MFEVPDVDFVRSCGVVFCLVYCLFNLCRGECYYSYVDCVFPSQVECTSHFDIMLLMGISGAGAS